MRTVQSLFQGFQGNRQSGQSYQAFEWSADGAGGRAEDGGRERRLRLAGVVGVVLAVLGVGMLVGVGLARGSGDQSSQKRRPEVQGAERQMEVPVLAHASPSKSSSTTKPAITTTTTTTTTLNLSTWRVIFDGAVNVSKFPKPDVPVMQVHWKCDLLRGRRVGDWLEVYNGTGGVVGYSPMVFNGSSMLAEDTSGRNFSELVAAKRRLAQDTDVDCTPCADDEPCMSVLWQINHPGHLMVYPKPNNETTPLGLVWKCDVRSGYPISSSDHQQWLKLTDEDSGKPGYIHIVHHNRQPVVAEVTASSKAELNCDACVEGGGDSCLNSQCCKNPGHKCYQSNEYWASCKYGCTPSENDKCLQLGTRSWAPQLPGFPTLYCWQLMRPDGYEPDLVRAQVARGAGIFGCDDFDVYSIEADKQLGLTPKGRNVTTVYCEPHDVGRSKDDTAANTEIFLNAWDAVKARGSWGSHGWTIKMDPDAVVVPNRLRVHIMSAGTDGMEQSVFFRTCNLQPENPDYPMMYGALEAISRKALDTFFRDGDQCQHWLPMADYGEDLFITKCLQRLGVGALDDYSLVGDDRCKGGACWDHTFAAFHEFKNVDDWMRCWEDTLNGRI